MRSPLLLALAALALLAAISPSQAQPSQSHNILDYGALPNNPSTEASLQNSKALVSAFQAATRASRQMGFNQTRELFWERVGNYSEARNEGRIPAGSPTLYTPQQTVLVPAGFKFFISYTLLRDVLGVQLQIDGMLLFNEDQDSWWSQAPEGYYGGLHFIDSSDVSIVGKHQRFSADSKLPTTSVDVDGQGYDWWLAVLLEVFDHRPHMMFFERCSRVSFTSLYVRDAPMFHFLLEDSEDVYYGDFSIYTDVVKQKQLTRAHATPAQLAAVKDGDLPLFPLNTDGVDPSAENVLIERFYIEMYDDAVAVKPCNGGGKFCTCASNMLIRDGAVKWGVGLTIGSVPPHLQHNCVRNVTFRNIDMLLPFKALYIKTNPGDKGSGSIKMIHFEDVRIDTPLWYPIWFGPQQQKQPANGTDTGCSFFYPLNTTCPTQPRITIDDIRVVNVSSWGGLTLPGVLLCDPLNPCTNVVFNNVTNEGPFLVSKSYVCENTKGVQLNNQPAMKCLTQISGEELQALDEQKALDEEKKTEQERKKRAQESSLVALW